MVERQEDDCTVVREIFPVTMESVDAVGIAFFGAYWNWYESTFERFVSAASGSSWRQLLASGLAMPIVHAEIDYLRPLRLSDEVTVDFRLLRLGSRSIHFEARFHDGNGEPVAVARTVNVLTQGDALAPADFPDWLETAVDTAAGPGDHGGGAPPAGTTSGRVTSGARRDRSSSSEGEGPNG